MDVDVPAVEPSGTWQPEEKAWDSISILFAIDSSYSMYTEQEAIRTIIAPTLIDGIARKNSCLPGGQIRIGVNAACPSDPDLHTYGWTPTWPESEKMQCNFSTGRPWMSEYSPRLTEELACATSVYSPLHQSKVNTCSIGTDDDERPLATAMATLEKYQGTEFFNDRTLVIIVAVTDEDEYVPEGVEFSLRDAVDRVAYDISLIHVFGAAGKTDCSGAERVSFQASRGEEFYRQVESLGDNGRTYDLCADSAQLAPAVVEFVAGLGTVCEIVR